MMPICPCPVLSGVCVDYGIWCWCSGNRTRGVCYGVSMSIWGIVIGAKWGAWNYNPVAPSVPPGDAGSGVCWDALASKPARRLLRLRNVVCRADVVGSLTPQSAQNTADCVRMASPQVVQTMPPPLVMSAGISSTSEPPSPSWASMTTEWPSPRREAHCTAVCTSTEQRTEVNNDE
jgi:hypothetical protein